MMPLPTRISPPQSPPWRWPSARDDVKTIGEASVPWALILAPRRTKSDDPTVLKSPTIRVPASMVRVAPFATWMKPLRM